MGKKQEQKQNRKQNIIAAVILAICLLLVAVNMVTTLAGQTKAAWDNPIEGISEGSSHVLYTGEGYLTADLENNESTEAMSIVEEVLEETKPDEEETEEAEAASGNADGGSEMAEDATEDGDAVAAEAGELPSAEEEYEPVTNQYEDGNPVIPTPTHPDEEDDNNNQSGADTPTPTPTTDPNDGKYPVVYTNLVDMDGATVDAAFITIQVEAYDYNSRGITAEGVQVYGNGTQLYPTSAAGATRVTYRLDLQDTNQVYIVATDRYDLSTTTPTYTIYKGDENNQTPDGAVTISVKATTIGLGYLIPASEVEFYQGEQLPVVLLRLLDACGYGYRYEGNLTSGFYLQRITRAGMLDGWQTTYIEADLLQHLIDENDPPQEPDTTGELGEFMITGNSGWMFYVNGESYGMGMSNYYPADGDEVELKFSLFKGADTGGAMSGDTWEKEW